MDRTAKYLHADDSEIQYEVCHELHERGGYSIISIPNMFVFAIPEDKAIPVMLHANLDTVRTLEEVPPDLQWRETRTDNRPDSMMFNTKGRLGAGRVGLRLAVEASQMYQEKPFLLFTNYNKEGALGMERAIREKVLEPYLDYIFAVISCTRSGWNYFSTRYYEDDGLPEVAQQVGFIQKGVKLDDIALMEDVYGIRTINVSCGVFNKDTFNEYLSDFAYYSVRENLMLLMPSIRQPYRCPIDMEQSEYIYNNNLLAEALLDPAGTASTKCVICGRPERETIYDEYAGVWVCQQCTNRANSRGIILSPKTIEGERLYLDSVRVKTRRANLGNFRKKHSMPICPMCGVSTEVSWSPERDVYWCRHCHQEFFMGKHKGKPTHMYLNKEGRVITRYLNKKDDTILRNEPLTQGSSIIRCPVCGEMSSHPVTVRIYNPYEDHTQQVRCCPECVDTVKEINTQLQAQGSEYDLTYTFNL